MRLPALVLAMLFAAAATLTGPAPTARAAGSNSLANQSFETGAAWPAPWRFKTTSPATGTITRDAAVSSHSDASARINVTRTSSSPWHVQLQQAGFSLTAGRSYELSFWSRAPSPRNVELVLQRASSPYTVLLARTFTVDATWRKFRAYVTPSSAVSSAMLSLNLAQAAGQVWIDDVAVWSNGYSKLGVSAHLMWGGMQNPRSQQTGWMQSGHMKWARFDVGWRWLEPNNNQYSQSLLSSLDATLDDLQSKGIRPVITFVETPGWANGNRGMWYPPSNPADYASAIGFLASRYRNRPNMAYEIWNEPNLVEKDANGNDFSKYWRPVRSASAYTAMLKAAYSSIKANDPDAIVLGGSIVFYDAAFLDAMYAAGAKGSFDHLAIHPYGFSEPPDDTGQWGFTGIVQRMKAKLDQHGDGGRKLWITEVGWWDRAITGNPNHPTDAMRGVYLQEMARIVDGLSYVEMVAAHALAKADEPDAGLIYGDGTPTASWTAYKAAADAAD